MKILMVTLGLLFQLMLCSCSSSPQLPALPVDGVILAFGDSLTAGNGATPDSSYPAVLSRLTGQKVVNAGVPGEVTAAALARLPNVLDREKPALVLLCLGGNDFLQRLDIGQSEENLRTMVQMIRAKRLGVVLIGVPKLGWGLEVPKWYGQIAKDAGIPYEGKALQRILSERSLKSDTIHPNAAGYNQLAVELAKTLKKSGALR